MFPQLTIAGIINTQSHIIKISVINPKSNDGQVVLDIFTNAYAFPTKPELVIKRLTTEIQNYQATFTLKINESEYAFSFFHDENTNNRLDANLIGIAKEGACASNNAKGRMEPPKYVDTKIYIDSPTEEHVEMYYVGQ